ncbi:MAG: 50S ribosomal protein L10 [Candidatus Sumerlaeota bacterium]|nr:50S ribosomal protein L10 [Candidatus Sumerlaeota bacterium]
MPSKVKIDLVAKAREQMTQAKSIVVTGYRGMSVAEMTDLRVKMRAQGVVIRVVKNRLAKIALKEAGLPAPEAHLKGPSAFVFSMKDPVAGPKILTEYAKTNAKMLVRCGIFEKVLLDAAGVAMLALLPSRGQMLGRLLGDLKSPVTRLAISLKATVSKVAYALKAVAEKKEKAA